jgi:hypothetical protein
MSNHIHPTIALRSKPFTQSPPSNKMARPLQTQVYDSVVVELAQYVNSTAELKGRFDLAIKQARDSGIVEMRKINDMDDFYDYCNEVSAALVLETVHFICFLTFILYPPQDLHTMFFLSTVAGLCLDSRYQKTNVFLM